MMIELAPNPALVAEHARLAELYRYRILDTEAEQSFDDLTLLASRICNAPIALISLVDAERQWFKAATGTTMKCGPRATSFCAHAINQPELFVVEDARLDERFRDNPLVTGDPHIRFYAGMPLIAPSGHALGTICIIDHVARKLRPDQVDAMHALARQIQDLLELRHAAWSNARLARRLKVSSRRLSTQEKVARELAEEKCGLREAVQGMERVLGIVGHELRTPLAVIRAMSEFLTTEGAKETPEADRFLQEIQHEVDRMSDTVNHVLEAARLNSGKTRWNWSSFDLVAVVRSAVATMQPLIDSQSVEMVLTEVGVEIPIAGDADAIGRLMLNLLGNARKYTDKGNIAVSIRPYTDTEGVTWADLIVSDTGSGIPPEVMAKLGEAFTLNSGVVGANHVSGTGLGLSICKAVAAAHGGRLIMQSVVGQGTAVRVPLRLDLPAACTGETVAAEDIGGLS